MQVIISPVVYCDLIVVSLVVPNVEEKKSARRNSPSYFKAVFIICYSETNSFENVILLGTAFAISSDCIVTALHVLVGDDRILLSSTFFIGTGARKNGEVHELSDAREVKLIYQGAIFQSTQSSSASISNMSKPEIIDIQDWAILRFCDESIKFDNFLSICEHCDLPDTGDEEELKCYHAPIGQYLNSDFEYISIWSTDYKRVLQYNLARTKICCAEGLYRGSCGAPYLNHAGKVVAMHISSMHEGKEYSDVKYKKRRTVYELEKHVDSTITDMNEVHANVREGIVLRNIEMFIQSSESLI
jgi:hypothetical protein